MMHCRFSNQIANGLNISSERHLLFKIVRNVDNAMKAWPISIRMKLMHEGETVR